jgi:N-acetylmuramoyl-L-alanine amidase
MSENPTPAPKPDVEPIPAETSHDFHFWTVFQTIISVGIVAATLFTLWTPANLFSNQLLENMFLSIQSHPTQVVYATTTPLPKPHIGLISGHWGNDSGSVCQDGLTEQEVNMKIATLVQQSMQAEGYDVDMLKEFDPKITQYQGLLLLSIHNDSCTYVNDQATGFKVAANTNSSAQPEKSSRLLACLVSRYQTITGLAFRYNSITDDMTQYHAFREINSNTPAAIIETGFLNLDRQILTEHTDVVAKGITDGLLCFIRNEDVPSQVIPTP